MEPVFVGVWKPIWTPHGSCRTGPTEPASCLPAAVPLGGRNQTVCEGPLLSSARLGPSSLQGYLSCPFPPSRVRNCTDPSHWLCPSPSLFLPFFKSRPHGRSPSLPAGLGPFSCLQGSSRLIRRSESNLVRSSLVFNFYVNITRLYS